MTPVAPLADRLRGVLAGWASTWHSSLTFTVAELRVLGDRLYRLAIQVAGEPQDEEHVVDVAAVEAWAIEAASEGLGRHFRQMAQGLGRPSESFVRWMDVAPDPPVVLGRWEARVDLSEASLEELAQLPGLSPALAARIVVLRESGGLREVDDLLSVSGLGPKRVATLRPLVYISRSARPPALSTPTLDAFRRRPAVAAYVDLIAACGGRFVAATRTGGAADQEPRDEAASDQAEMSLRSAVLAEVSRALRAAATSPAPGGGGRPITVEEAARLGRLFRRGRQLAASSVASAEADWIGLVNGSAYRDLGLRLIDGARHEITVAMFFMTYVPGGDHPSNALVDGLVAAHRRGVRVSVTLDLDRPEDVFGSRLVNEAAFQCLRAAGVDVAWDRPDRLTHTKLLIVDGRDVLAGSHNWTAGSIYAYDDKSLVIRSTALAEALRDVARGIRGE